MSQIFIQASASTFLFLFFIFIFIFKYIPVNTHQVGFIYLLRAGGLDVHSRDWRRSRGDVITSEPQRVGPCILFGCPPRVRRDTRVLWGRQPKGRSSPHTVSAPRTVPSIRPVWWILFSALLSWVIWGIIPKVSQLNCRGGRVGSMFILAQQSYFFRSGDIKTLQRLLEKL